MKSSSIIYRIIKDKIREDWIYTQKYGDFNLFLDLIQKLEDDIVNKQFICTSSEFQKIIDEVIHSFKSSS